MCQWLVGLIHRVARVASDGMIPSIVWRFSLGRWHSAAVEIASSWKSSEGDLHRRQGVKLLAAGGRPVQVGRRAGLPHRSVIEVVLPWERNAPAAALHKQAPRRKSRISTGSIALREDETQERL